VRACLLSQRFQGIHRLPVLLRISQGRQFWLVLEGRTLEAETPYIFPFAGPDQVLELFPVPIGTSALQAPAQYTELSNSSDVDVTYEVDTSVLDKLRKRNHDYPVLLLENPRGTILARQKVLLKVRCVYAAHSYVLVVVWWCGGGARPYWRGLFVCCVAKWWFNPVESKTYNARIHVSYKGGSSLIDRVSKFTLRCIGYDPRNEDFHRCAPCDARELADVKDVKRWCVRLVWQPARAGREPWGGGAALPDGPPARHPCCALGGQVTSCV
jgi:hypothetical protein